MISPFIAIFDRYVLCECLFCQIDNLEFIQNLVVLMILVFRQMLYGSTSYGSSLCQQAFLCFHTALKYTQGDFISCAYSSNASFPYFVSPFRGRHRWI